MTSKVFLRMGRQFRIILLTLALLWAASMVLIIFEPDFSNDSLSDAFDSRFVRLRRDEGVGKQDFQRVKTKFYIYEEYSITQELSLEVLRLQGQAAFYGYAFQNNILNAVSAERATLEALEKHPLRTRDPNEAELYIIPTPISELFAYGCWNDDCKQYDLAFETLRCHEIFLKTQGHNHILISYGLYHFSKRYAGYIPALSRNYRILENVTVASHFDPFASLKLAERTRGSQDKGFNYLFPHDGPVAKAFSIGLGLDAAFEIHPPTIEKFQQSEYFIFYHTPSTAYGYGSTPFRQALLEFHEENAASVPRSSIGHDLESDEWPRQLSSSQFCLVVRGNTPHSHSLLYAIRAGCIPVIVSDFLKEYASPFRSSLRMDEFCVFVEEEAFVHDTASVLAKLQNLSHETIQSKLHNLAMAQSIVLPDHPNSLFVEAFLKEAIIANRRIAPAVASREATEISEDKAVISGRKLRYRFPSSFSSRERSQSNVPVLVVGVLSTASKPAGRFAVRNTWAEEYHDDVLFVVSGPWNEIENEFLRYGDILWIDMPEEYLLLTYKTQLFFNMVETHVKSYDYAMKADDDSYVGVPEVRRIISKIKPDYWGYCLEDEEFRVANRNTSYVWYTPEEMYPDKLFPPYAQGLGFVLSRDFVKCAVSKLGTCTYLPWEDTSMGILAAQCGFICRRDEFVFYGRNREPGLTTVEHHVKTSEKMIQLHWTELKKKKIGKWENILKD